MVIRSLVVAALLVGAASAHATPTSSKASTVVGWTLQSGSVSVVSALNSIEAGNMAAWSVHTTMAAQDTASGNSAVLFAPNAPGNMFGIASSSAVALADGGGAVIGADAGGGESGSGSSGDNLDVGAGGDLNLDVAAPVKASFHLDVPGVGDGISAAQVPEPGSIALLLAGLAGAGFASRRRSR